MVSLILLQRHQNLAVGVRAPLLLLRALVPTQRLILIVTSQVVLPLGTGTAMRVCSMLGKCWVLWLVQLRESLDTHAVVSSVFVRLQELPFISEGTELKASLANRRLLLGAFGVQFNLGSKTWADAWNDVLVLQVMTRPHLKIQQPNLKAKPSYRPPTLRDVAIEKGEQVRLPLAFMGTTDSPRRAAALWPESQEAV